MYIRTNKAIKTAEDVRNLMTSIILRQTKPFKYNQILERVNGYLKGSKFNGQNKLIQELLDSSLDVFSRNDIIACWNGTWYPKDVDGYFIAEYFADKRNCVN